MTTENKTNSNSNPDKPNKTYKNRTFKKNVPDKGKRTPPGPKKKKD